jgi:hypothetical protein
MVRELLHQTPHIRLTLKSTIPSYSTTRPSRDLVAAAQAGEAPEEFAESQDTEDN